VPWSGARQIYIFFFKNFKTSGVSKKIRDKKEKKIITLPCVKKPHGNFIPLPCKKHTAKPYFVYLYHVSDRKYMANYRAHDK